MVETEGGLGGLYGPGVRGICPHCGQDVRFVRTRDYSRAVHADGGGRPGGEEFYRLSLASENHTVSIEASECYLCKGIVVWGSAGPRGRDARPQWRIWPIGAARPLPDSVPPNIAEVFERAARLLGFDETASAAFARTCLDKVLDQQDVPKLSNNLADRISHYLARGTLSSELQANLDVIREMGNFVHLNESLSTGDAVDVTGPEAQWVLDILGSLFEEIYAKPQQDRARRSSFEAKMGDVGKRRGRAPDPDGGDGNEEHR